MNFGETLKIFLFVGKIKMKDLAAVLEYDPSYISKWVNNDLLPNRKSVELLLTKASHFLAEKIIASKKNIQWPDYFDATDVPEKLDNYHDLQSFIFKTLMASYNRSDKLAHTIVPKDESEFFVERNTCSSYHLDDIITTIHGTCSNAINKYDTLHVISSLPIHELVPILDSQVKSYCMMFRSTNVHLRYYMDVQDHPLKTLDQAYALVQRLRTINPQSSVDIYAKPQDMTSFICTEGCYIVYKTDILGRPLYHMINEENSVSLYSDHILHYPYDDTPLFSLTAPDESEPSFAIVQRALADDALLRLYITDLKILLDIEATMAASHRAASENTEMLYTIYRAMHERIQRGAIEFYFDRKAVEHFLAHPPMSLRGYKPTTAKAKMLLPSLLRRCAEDVTFFVVDHNLLETEGFTSSILLGPNAFFYTTSDMSPYYHGHHFLTSTAPDVVDMMALQFEHLRSDPNTKKYDTASALNLMEQFNHKNR